MGTRSKRREIDKMHPIQKYPTSIRLHQRFGTTMQHYINTIICQEGKNILMYHVELQVCTSSTLKHLSTRKALHTKHHTAQGILQSKRTLINQEHFQQIQI